MTVYRFIASEKANYPVSLMCELLEVTRQGFYAWLKRPLSDRVLSDRLLLEPIGRIFDKSDGTYGSPRIHAQLALDGIFVSPKRVERLMREAGLKGVCWRPKRIRTTIRVPGIRPALDHVDRNFTTDAPNKVWSADITQFDTEEGTLYLGEIVDLFSRACVGWAMRDNMQAEVVTDALEMALARRRPDAGLIHHSDQGSQYTSLVFSSRCKDAGIARSMGSRGDCFDNAVCESFHATIKRELTTRTNYKTRQEARTAIFKWIEGWYNPHRLHSTNGNLSPLQYENNYHKQVEQEQALVPK